MDAAAPPPASTPPCDALELLPPDLWMHALEMLEEKRDVVHAAACCRSLRPMAGVGDMLNWELFNSWYEEEYKENKIPQGELPVCDGLGPEVLSACGRFMLQTGGGSVFGNPGLPSKGMTLYFFRPHAFVIQGPATAGDVLSAMMKEFARDLARNTIFEELLGYIQYKVDFVQGSEGPLKDPNGLPLRRVMVDNDELGGRAANIIKTLGLTDERLFESFAKNVFPGWCKTSRGLDSPITFYGDSRPVEEYMDLVLGITDPDPTVTMRTEDLIALSLNMQDDDLLLFLERLVPANSPELLPPDLWMHALEMLEEKRDVVHASTCCRSLVPMAGVGNKLNWELFNSWYKEEYVAHGKGVTEGELPACDGLGPEVLSARGCVMLQGGEGANHGGFNMMGNPGLASGGIAVSWHCLHAFVIEGPATAGDVLSALMKQVARERARNTILKQLFEYVQYNVGFVDDPEGPLEDLNGPALRRVMVDNDQAEWAADLIKTLGLTDEHLFESFSKNVIPPECMSSRGLHFPITLFGDSRPVEEYMDFTLGITDPDPTVTMSTEDLIELARGYEVWFLTSFQRLVPADAPEASTGWSSARQLAGEAGQRVYRAMWGEMYEASD
ncbi:hypothetical protein FOA52_003961 [Chlamydomonas sp. UWO 241]|nr:hypothetical protein FOA52_003961 [Chlamydomonas sp. UWO 241]